MPREIILAPIVEPAAATRGIQDDIIDFFKEAIFQPLFDLLDNSNVATRQNAVSGAVVQALRDRQIWYANGAFTGRFNAAISRELRKAGAIKTESTFAISLSNLPMEWRLEIQSSTQAAEELGQKALDMLNQMQANVKQAPTGLNLKFSMDGVFVDLRKQFEKTMQAHGLGVPPDLSQGVKDDITKEYTTNMELYIKNFTEQIIPELRTKIQDLTFEGMRPDKLAKIIEAEYGVTKRKAVFLADQETSLLLSKYRESRYKAVGSQRYVWSGNNDARERPDHRLLNGKTFFWDSPPITNRATGARNNPGEDFGCRCVARPILPIQED